MDDPSLSPELIRFLRRAVPSYDALNLLVWLHAHRDGAWTVAHLALQLDLDQSIARTALEGLTNAGLLVGLTGGFRYMPRSLALDALVAAAVRELAQRPAELLQVLNQNAVTRLRRAAGRRFAASLNPRSPRKRRH